MTLDKLTIYLPFFGTHCTHLTILQNIYPFGTHCTHFTNLQNIYPFGTHCTHLTNLQIFTLLRHTVRTWQIYKYLPFWDTLYTLEKLTKYLPFWDTLYTLDKLTKYLPFWDTLYTLDKFTNIYIFWDTLYVHVKIRFIWNQGDQPKMFVYASVPIKKGKTWN